MRLPCPHCGDRDRQEFTVFGEAPGPRPDGMDASAEAMFDYVYLRNNVAGVHRELWYHGAGCHAWLVVERDTRNHNVIAVTEARHALHMGAAP